MIKQIVFTVFISMFVCQINANENRATINFKLANEYYINKQYDSAIFIYESILKNNIEAAEIYFNLGNAYFKKNEIAKAIINYERAHRLNPNDKDILFNLQLAQTFTVDKITALPEFFLKKWYRSFKNIFSSNQWAIWGLVLFIITLIAIVLYLFGSYISIKKWGFYSSILFFLLSLTSIYNSISLKNEHLLRNTGVIITPTVTVKSSPDETGTELFVIHEGTKVWLLDKIGEWIRIKIADGNNGWLKEEDIERI